ncbi:MAG: M3 family oligoendopeptidase [Nitrospirae bacterium]|nr:M3 family oligoendopeptidase [Nitrospirota bacterium]
MKRSVWNLRPLFEDDSDPRMEERRKIVEKKSYEFIRKWKDRRDYLVDPAVLRKALDEYEEWNRYYGADGDEGYYFMLRTQQDQNDPKLKANYNRIEEFSHRIQNDIQFFHIRISKIPRTRQKMFLRQKGLKPYRHYLERLFAESRFLLSEAEEKILTLKAPTSYSNWVRMTSGFLAKEEREILSEDGGKSLRNFSEILSLMNSPSRRVRDSGAKAFNEIMRKHSDVAEAELNAILANKKTDDTLRRMDRPDLGRHVSDDIESGIVDALIGTVLERFPIAARYYELKAGLLGVKLLKYHERNVEYGRITGQYSFAKSAGIIRKVLRRLDAKFADIFAAFLDNGFIDALPRQGKASGAFCAHHLISQPTYILLNHTGKFNDVLTLAHEVGHGINNELMKEKQNALNFGSPLSTAEVASTFMEDFVLQELLREADDELRLAVLMNKLNDDVSTIFRQAACYRFEQELHQAFRQKGYLAKEEIGAIFRKHMAAYMGDFVEQSPGSENWWVYWGHIRHFFYVYSYASGLLISKSLQNSVKENPRFIEKVKDFLSAGSSESPRNIFEGLGIDIAETSFWDRGLDEVENLLQETETLARRLGKIR